MIVSWGVPELLGHERQAASMVTKEVRLSRAPDSEELVIVEYEDGWLLSSKTTGARMKIIPSTQRSVLIVID